MTKKTRKLSKSNLASLWTTLRRVAGLRWVRGLAIAVLLIAPSAVAYVTATSSPNILPANTMGNMYLQPGQLNLATGKPVLVTVRIEPGTPIDTVTATLAYDTQALTYTAVSYADSPFTTQIPATTSSSRVTVQSAKFGDTAVTNDSVVAILTFTAQRDGITTIDLTGDAARAGVATHPTMNGKVVPVTSNAKQGGNNAASQASPDAARASAPVVTSSIPGATPVRNVLTTLGMSGTKATAVAPVLMITLVVAALAVCGGVYYQRRIRAHRALAHQRIEITPGGKHEHH